MVYGVLRLHKWCCQVVDAILDFHLESRVRNHGLHQVQHDAGRAWEKAKIASIVFPVPAIGPKIGGQTIPYKATAATVLIKNDKDEPTALLYSTASTRSDVKDVSQRAVSFLYNGGPGSSSVWLHTGSMGPRRVVTINAGVTPPAPYKLMDNPDCLLDKSDLVFIDPVGTGFSHAVGKAQDKDFWGVDPDVKSLAQFITTSPPTSAATTGGIPRNFSLAKAMARFATRRSPITCKGTTTCI